MNPRLVRLSAFQGKETTHRNAYMHRKVYVCTYLPRNVQRKECTKEGETGKARTEKVGRL